MHRGNGDPLLQRGQPCKDCVRFTCIGAGGGPPPRVYRCCVVQWLRVCRVGRAQLGDATTMSRRRAAVSTWNRTVGAQGGWKKQRQYWLVHVDGCPGLLRLSFVAPESHLGPVVGVERRLPHVISPLPITRTPAGPATWTRALCPAW